MEVWKTFSDTVLAVLGCWLRVQWFSLSFLLVAVALRWTEVYKISWDEGRMFYSAFAVFNILLR